MQAFKCLDLSPAARLPLCGLNSCPLNPPKVILFNAVIHFPLWRAGCPVGLRCLFPGPAVGLDSPRQPPPPPNILSIYHLWKASNPSGRRNGEKRPRDHVCRCEGLETFHLSLDTQMIRNFFPQVWCLFLRTLPVAIRK